MSADDASSKENVSIRPLCEDGYDWIFPDQLPDAARRQLFWVIKRHSSYTAWARAFAAFDAVINKMESLLPELAAKPFGTYAVGLPPDSQPFTVWPDWEYILKWRCEYRAALACLRRGDKAVLGIVPSKPLLATQAESCLFDLAWFFQGIHPREGYHSIYDPIIPEKAVLTMLAWQAFRLAAENVKLTGTPMDSAPHRVSITQMYSSEHSMLKNCLPQCPNMPNFSFGEDYYEVFSRYPIPADLPPVPEPVILPNQNAPWWAPAGQRGGPLVFQSDDIVFVPGIYLSDPYGDIRYLHVDMPAPFISSVLLADTLPCTWTLIWRDDRYENGADIPEEEALYFPEG